MLSKKSLLVSLGLAMALLTGFAKAATYPTEISYNIVNNSNVNLTGIPAHSTLPTSKLPFPPDRPYSYSVTFGVDKTPIQLCVGVGINNFSTPYVGAYALKTTECAVAVATKKNSETDYTVIVTDSSN